MAYVPPTDWELKDFYRAHVDSIYRSCNFLTCGKADVPHMVSEIFLKLLTKGMYFSSEADARAWMILQAYKKSRKAMKCHDGNGQTPGFSQEICKLSRKNRLVAVMYYCEGYRRSEIANYLGCTSFAVSRRLKKIQKRISDAHEPEAAEEDVETSGQADAVPQTIQIPAPVPQTEVLGSGEEGGASSC